MHPVITGAMIFTTRIDMVRAPPPYVLMNVWSTDNDYIIIGITYMTRNYKN